MIKQYYFSIEGGASVQGYCTDRSWNGWSRPGFTFEQAIKMVNMSVYGPLRYDPINDAFVWDDPSAHPEHDLYKGEYFDTEHGRKKLYCIGDGWVWERS